MQVLNAPSRREIDKAHIKGSFLGVGVPSVRNAFAVSPFKTWKNSLLAAGGKDELGYNSRTEIPGSSFTQYGFNQNISEYLRPNAPAVTNISSATASAAKWDRISARECYNTLNGYNPLNNTYRSGLLGDGDLTVKYCLAEPTERICHVGVSTTLLVAVSVCILIKTAAAITATCVLGGRNHEPLVTLGDAVQSFLCRPDPTTARRCLLSQRDASREEEQAHKRFKGPRQWLGLRHRRWSVVPWSVWATSYILFAIGIAAMASLFGTSVEYDGLRGSFTEGDQNTFSRTRFTFTEGVLVANSPQLLLSICYLAYNSMINRLQMAREWSSFINGYRPLRVTDPKSVTSPYLSICPPAD
ncbi:hypothetical protein PG994_010932 [Apiospora phragmitis]|uniref:DUF6536 domain-containing protein n=1 Tax=Apiospora phragmitis TaxID=2905665 RepID=A0ABR1TRG6_9PEZI